MKIIRLTLVNIWHYPATTPHFGLCSLAAFLEKKIKNIKISIIEGLNPYRQIIKSNPDLIGYTSNTLTFNKTKKLAKKVKNKLPRLQIIGGVHITAHPQSFAPPFDVAVLGEGEQALLKIVKAFPQVPQTIYQEKPIKNIDSLPFPARHLVPMTSYLNHQTNLFGVKRQATIMTSRGCPYNCVFCGSPVQWPGVRFHSAEYVFKEILHLHQTYRIDGIMFWDDLFITPLDRLKKLKNLIVKHRLHQKITFVGYGRANLITKKICHILKQMNVKRLIFGLESGSPKILSYLKQNSVTVAQNARAIKLCRQFGISPVSGYIIGTPGETAADLQKTFLFMKNYPLDNTQIYILTPYPGTQLWQLMPPKFKNWQQLFVQLPPLKLKDFFSTNRRLLHRRIFLNPNQKNNYQYLKLITQIRRLAFIQNSSYYLKSLPSNLHILKKIIWQRF